MRQLFVTGRASKLKQSGLVGICFAPDGVISRTALESFVRAWRTASVLSNVGEVMMCGRCLLVWG